MTELAKRRRALLAAGVGTIELKPGQYGNAIVTRPNTIDVTSQAIWQWISLPISKAIPITAGDTLSFSLTGLTARKEMNVRLKLSDNTNLTWTGSQVHANSWYNFPSASSNSNVTHFEIRPRTSTDFNNFHCQAHLRINGEDIF